VNSLTISLWFVACAEPDPIREAMLDPAWCPSSFDGVLSESWARMQCEAAACEEPTLNVDTCMEELTPPMFREYPGFTCFDGCTMRDCLDGWLERAECVPEQDIPESLREACYLVMKSEGDCS
jgi:hypothetical protein